MSIEHSFVIVYTNSLKFLKHERFNANFFFRWVEFCQLHSKQR